MQQTLKFYLLNMVLDCLIVGGGVSGMQCALVLGSAQNKPFASDKKISIIIHQKASHLQNALFNNVLGLAPKTLGKDILQEGKNQLSNLYPEVNQIEKEKVLSIQEKDSLFLVQTNKNVYQCKIVVFALNYAKPLNIKGLEKYTIPHKKSNPKKDRIQLKNTIEAHFLKTKTEKYRCI